MRTYDVQITNMRTNESVFLAGSKQGLSHLTPPLKGFGDPDFAIANMCFLVPTAVALMSSFMVCGKYR